MQLIDYITCVPDFPNPGIMFRDISPLLAAPKAFQFSIDRFSDTVRIPLFPTFPQSRCPNRSPAILYDFRNWRQCDSCFAADHSHKQQGKAQTAGCGENWEGQEEWTVAIRC